MFQFLAALGEVGSHSDKALVLRESMDLVLGFCDRHFFTPYVYPPWLLEGNLLRQTSTLLVITTLGGLLLYLVTAALSYVFLFDKNLLEHPLIIKVCVQVTC